MRYKNRFSHCAPLTASIFVLTTTNNVYLSITQSRLLFFHKFYSSFILSMISPSRMAFDAMMTHRSPPARPEVHKIVIDICEQQGEWKGKQKLFIRRKISLRSGLGANLTWTRSFIRFPCMLSSAMEIAKVLVIGRNVSWFSVIDSFLCE